MKCEYCQHESEPGDIVKLYHQGAKRKPIMLCLSTYKCLQRQLANPPPRTEKKTLAGVR